MESVYRAGDELSQIFEQNNLKRNSLKPGDKEYFYYSKRHPLSIKFDNHSIYLLNHGRCIKSILEVSPSEVKLLILCLKLNTAQLRALFPGGIFKHFPANTFDYFRQKHTYLLDSGSRITTVP